jgi:hypothetical protein
LSGTRASAAGREIRGRHKTRRDPRISRQGAACGEKRAILASWASDACAVEAAPALRRVPGGRLVTFDDVMDALRLLDRDAGQIPAAPRYRRVLENRIQGMFGGKSGGAPHGGQGPPIS